VAARKLYGFRGFIFHQTIELLAFPTITASFIAWILRRKRPFAVTPKKAEKIPFKLVLPYVTLLVILIASVVKGAFYISGLNMSPFWFAVIVNIFWATYFIPFITFGVYTVFRYYEKEAGVKILERVYEPNLFS
ncbi:hypothetical protein DRP07_05550, partial [Archaeoglobales archaeon]